MLTHICTAENAGRVCLRRHDVSISAARSSRRRAAALARARVRIKRNYVLHRVRMSCWNIDMCV